MRRMWKHALIAACIALAAVAQAQAQSQSPHRPLDKPAPTRISSDASAKPFVYELALPARPGSRKRIVRGPRRFET
jgi:hypothetical protein